jgi:hypothetical protein
MYKARKVSLARLCGSEQQTYPVIVYFMALPARISFISNGCAPYLPMRLNMIFSCKASAVVLRVLCRELTQ